ncbi:ATPase family AAA domain-containing protein 2-like isoform X2 [Cottoperca gobio]|uniref:ATPase family AAA domain-containing protein 2-like isoform X2 n=1 Tax=Cottoperca gobio TaxID=56716 RepID=A0A6J2QPW6_COTGO|nr:ATPase family AAA domain-containing protein 2-like isoform X2 [Cottoperca gobio]
MVTLRTRGTGDAYPSTGPLQQQMPSNSPLQAAPGIQSSSSSTVPRPEESALCDRINDDDQNYVDSETHEDEDEKPQRAIIRKSPRLQNTADGGKRSGLRRSTRSTKPTCRYQDSNMFDGIGTNTARLVLNKMDNMKKKRHLSNNKKGKTRTPVPPQTEPSDNEDDNGLSQHSGKCGVVDEESRQEVAADEDSNCSTNQNFDAKMSRASSLYEGPSSEFQRGTFRISASGSNTTRRAAFRPTKSALSNQSDEDNDSDDEVQNVEKVLGSCRPLGLRTEDLLGTCRDQMNAGAGLADIDPMAIDQSVGFDSIGGLSGHISALKEMIVFPLLYPEVFDNFKIQPPRGCLFYGPPGTGKTLVARALANECSHGNRKVAFFMRKGADCLSKWVGESERQLRLLFEQAYQMRPAIVFFDEIDGLAPVRSSRQDQIHSSIVSTLLALMDGLDSRGEVVVIGATNRLDSIDPGLRRPGRFDREFLFGLPDRESRKEILKIHTRQWKPRPSEDFLDELAEKCVGYCGADIRAVCTEAALCALRRRYPQIYGTSQKLLLDVSSIVVSSCDFMAAMRKMSPASQRSAASPAKPLSPVVQPLLGATLRNIQEALQRLYPHAEQGMKRKREPDLTSGILDDDLMYGGDEASSIFTPSTSKSRNFLHFARSAVKHPTSHRPRMLLAGRTGSGQTSHLAPALLHALERFTVHSLDSAVLFGVSSTSPEEACVQVFCEARRTSPSIIYMPRIQQWWETAGSSLRASFLSLLGSIPSLSPILLLATCSIPHLQLDPEIQFLFREEYGEVYTISIPNRQERTDFFHDLILNQATEAPPSKRGALTMEILPLAPLPPPRQLPEQDRLHLEQEEEDVLRELRLFLRNITERLTLDRRFKAFTKPVDIEEVPDYMLVVKKPMDLSTLLTNIDEQKYVTVGEFVSDTDLIWQNALEYNPDSDPMDRHIRHRACALKDTVRAIIRDELDQDFERVCQEIKESRIKRASSCWTEVNPEEAHGLCSSTVTTNSPGPQRERERRETRANMEQMQLFNRDTSVENVAEETPLLVVDPRELRDLLSRAVAKTERSEAEPLEKLFALLAQCIYRHRNNHNKTELVQEMKKEIDSFS